LAAMPFLPWGGGGYGEGWRAYNRTRPDGAARRGRGFRL